jgi:hypothetical protein
LKNTKVKSVLVCQPKPETEKSPYFDLAKKHGLKIDFRPFIEVKALTPKEFRAQKINILEHTAIILNSRNSVDNFFRVCTELKIEMPIEMKGFGYEVAHMRGGFGLPIMLGTVGSPTQWRPISDDSFISLSLRQALDSLNNTLKTKNASLDGPTKSNVDTLITQLEAAEKAVKDERDNLNSFNNAIATGSANVQNKKNIDTATLTRTVDAYNNAMKNRQKLENKLFRVVIALGGKVQVI